MKSKIISIFLILLFTSISFAREPENNTEHPSKDSTVDTTSNPNEKNTFKRHTKKTTLEPWGLFPLITATRLEKFSKRVSFSTMRNLSRIRLFTPSCQGQSSTSIQLDFSTRSWNWILAHPSAKTERFPCSTPHCSDSRWGGPSP